MVPPAILATSTLSLRPFWAAPGTASPALLHHWLVATVTISSTIFIIPVIASLLPPHQCHSTTPALHSPRPCLCASSTCYELYHSPLVVMMADHLLFVAATAPTPDPLLAAPDTSALHLPSTRPAPSWSPMPPMSANMRWVLLLHRCRCRKQPPGKYNTSLCCSSLMFFHPCIGAWCISAFTFLSRPGLN